MTVPALEQWRRSARRTAHGRPRPPPRRSDRDASECTWSESSPSPESPCREARTAARGPPGSRPMLFQRLSPGAASVSGTGERPMPSTSSVSSDHGLELEAEADAEQAPTPACSRTTWSSPSSRSRAIAGGRRRPVPPGRPPPAGSRWSLREAGARPDVLERLSTLRR